MARTDFRTPRLYVEAPLAEGAEVRLDPQQTNYLVNVLQARRGRARASVQRPRRRIREASSRRLRARASRSLSAGASGRRRRRRTSITCSRRSSTPGSTIWRKRRSRWARGGSCRFITRRTQVARVNLERLRANAIEACEQCGVIWAPEVAAPVDARKGAGQLAARAAHRLLRRGGAAGEPARRAGRSQRGAWRRPPRRPRGRLRRRRAGGDPRCYRGSCA